MDSNQFQIKGFVVWIICAFFFLYEFFLRTVIGSYQHPIMNDFHITSLQFSLMSTTIFFVIYGLMQIPVGIIVDNIGLKKSLLIAAILCAASSLGFAYSYNYYFGIICRLFMGLGASFGFICLLISVYDWMPHKYSAIFIGLSQFIGTIGPMLAGGPMESISQTTNWRMVFTYLGIIGIILTFMILFFVENNQQKSGQYIILYKPEKIVVSIKRLFSRLQPWYIAVLSTGLYFTVEYLSENEGRSFLMLKGLSLDFASYMITVAWIGYGVGCPLLGLCSDLLERRKTILQISALLGLISIIAVLYVNNKLCLIMAFFLLGISASGQSIAFALVSEQFKKQFVAIGFGLNNAMITTVGAINAPLIGFLLDAKKNSSLPSLSDYLSVFNILIAMFVIALIIAVFLIKETYCKSAVDFTFLKKSS